MFIFKMMTGLLLGAEGATTSNFKCARICSANLQGQTKWVDYSKDGMYTDIDISHCDFRSTPAILTSLGGRSGHWTATGTSSIYSATKSSFRIYINFSLGSTGSIFGNKNDYYLNYFAHGEASCEDINACHKMDGYDCICEEGYVELTETINLNETVQTCVESKCKSKYSNFYIYFFLFINNILNFFIFFT